MEIDERVEGCSPAGPPPDPGAVPVLVHTPGPGDRTPEPEDRVDAEDRTRDRICREVLAQGPVTVAVLSATLGLTSTGVRRHLDVLLEQGMVTVWEVTAGTPHVQRRRGRPARQFVLTDLGHAAMATGYDDLAAQALRFLSTVAGPEAVRRFAAQRLADFEDRYRPVVDAAGPDPRARVQALAVALSDDGYAATARALGEAGTAGAGTQLCQGHCPVQYVAREFPQLCEAETDTFSRLLGVHVQRLATLAHGEHVCTTHVPSPQVMITLGPTRTERPDER